MGSRRGDASVRRSDGAAGSVSAPVEVGVVGNLLDLLQLERLEGVRIEGRLVGQRHSLRRAEGKRRVGRCAAPQGECQRSDADTGRRERLRDTAHIGAVQRCSPLPRTSPVCMRYALCAARPPIAAKAAPAKAGERLRRACMAQARRMRAREVERMLRAAPVAREPSRLGQAPQFQSPWNRDRPTVAVPLHIAPRCVFCFSEITIAARAPRVHAPRDCSRARPPNLLPSQHQQAQDFQDKARRLARRPRGRVHHRLPLHQNRADSHREGQHGLHQARPPEECVRFGAASTVVLRSPTAAASPPRASAPPAACAGSSDPRSATAAAANQARGPLP